MAQKILSFSLVGALGFVAAVAWFGWQSRVIHPSNSRVEASGADAELRSDGPTQEPQTLTQGQTPEMDAAADNAVDANPLRLTPSHAQTIAFDFRTFAQQACVVQVPDDAVVMYVRIEGAPCIFDIYGRSLLPIDDPTTDAEHYNGAMGNTLRVSRYDDYPLETGDYYLSIEYPAIYPPALGNRTLNIVECKIHVSFITTRVDGYLGLGSSATGSLTPETGSFRTYVVDVPSGTKALRVDLDNVRSDLDVLVRRGSHILHPEDADLTAAGRVGREILVIDEFSDPPLEPGLWYVHVVEPTGADRADFHIYVSEGNQPPPSLTSIPPFPDFSNARDRALYSVVDLTTGAYSGSGVFVGEQGIILTNHHVVAEALVAAQARDDTNSPPTTDQAPALDDVIVAITLDPHHPPVEMFRAEVVEHDAEVDLALVRITRGYYGQPIPQDYRFPFVELGEPQTLAIGDPLFVVGFPAVGDLRNRPAVTVTRGIVSGFSDTHNIKTDAHISVGNSGGGAFDEQWRLIGCPTMTVSGANGDFGQLGYVVSLEAAPESWRQHIK